MKRALKIFGWLLAGSVLFFTLLFGILSYVVLIHEDDIARELIEDFNEGQAGELTFEGLELSPFRAFPYISIDLKNVRFMGGKTDADSVPIYAFEDVYLGFDLFDLLRGEFLIAKVILSNGHFTLEKYEDGSYNLMTAKLRMDSSTDTSATSTYLDLQQIELQNIRFVERNLTESGHELLLDIINARSNLSYIGEKLKVGFKSQIFLHHYVSGPTTYFRELPFSLDCDIEYEDGLMTILPSKLRVETGSLDIEGTIEPDNDLMVDLHISGQKKNFNTFIAFAPPEIFEKLKEFRNEGDIYFKGHINGPLDIRNPLIDVELGCANTSFFHLHDEAALRDVAFRGRFRTGDDGGLEDAFILLENLYGEPEKGLLRGTFRVDNLLDPRYEMDFHARFDLEHLRTFYDLEAIEEGSGEVTIDITLNEFVGADSVLHFSTTMANGVMSNVKFKNVSLKLAGMNLSLSGLNGTILLDGDDIRATKLSAQLGKSDLSLDFLLKNVSALLHGYNSPVDLMLHGESKKLFMSELTSFTKEPIEAVWSSDTLTNLRFDLDMHSTVKAIEKARNIPKMEFNFRHLEFESAKYPFPVGDISGVISASDEHLNIRNFGISIGRNQLHLDADIKGLSALFDSTSHEVMHHQVTLKSRYFNAKELLVYDGNAFIHDSIEEEVIRDLLFRGSGTLHPASFGERGFLSSTHIDHFTARINDLPALRDVDGHIETDTTGTITLRGLKMAMGKSDVTADVYLRNFLDPNQKHNHIEGSIRSQLLDFDDLLGWRPEDTVAVVHEEAFNLFELAFPEMRIHADVGMVRHHRSLLEDVRGSLRTNKDHTVNLDTLHFRAADGLVAMSGFFNGTNPDSIFMHAVLRISQVDLDQVMYKMDNFGNDFVVNENVHGRLSGVLTIDALMHPDMVPDLSRTTVVADVRIAEGRLQNFAPMQAMADFMGDRDLNNIRFGELSNTFTFAGGELVVPEMKIASTLGYIYLSGRQSLEMDMHYTMRVPLGMVKRAGWSAIKGKLSRGAKRKEQQVELERIEEEIISEQRGLIKGYLNVSIVGTPDNYTIGMGKGE